MDASIPRTYLAPEGKRPTRGTISDALGFEVPTRFAEFVCHIFDYADGDSESCSKIFDAVLGLYPAGEDARYWGTPPELFPIGTTGCDGDHYGFILHAPECELDDLPYGHYCPMDSDGVILVGATTAQGIASKMARQISYDLLDRKEKKYLADIALRCNIQPDEESKPEIFIPDGYEFVPSADGVGTLAPSGLFDPQPVECNTYAVVAEFIDAAAQATKRGYLATALHHLRQGLWFNWTTRPFALAESMSEIYDLMNRGKLAAQVRSMMSLWRASGD